MIRYIFTSSFGRTNKGYIVYKELLHACLMWADPTFMCDVFSFLTRMREQDNDLLRREIGRLTNRYVPNAPEQQWLYSLSYKTYDDTVNFYSMYRRMSDEDDRMKDLKVKNFERDIASTTCSMVIRFALQPMSYSRTFSRSMSAQSGVDSISLSPERIERNVRTQSWH